MTSPTPRISRAVQVKVANWRVSFSILVRSIAAMNTSGSELPGNDFRLAATRRG